MKKYLIIILGFICLLGLNIYLIISINKINYNLNNIELYITNNKSNSSYRLKLTSSYGDNQAYHPKVLSFPKKWNGYKYWITYSPYPYANSDKENPHIKVSNDLVNWEEPINNLNPLDEVKNPENGLRYNSDPHLVYNDNTKELECWWRYVDAKENSITIYRRKTKDGKKWTKKEEIYTSKRDKNDWISPVIIYEDGIYKIWYVYKTKVNYIESKNLKEFTEPRIIDIEYEDSVKTWHLDIIHTDKGYEMIMVAFSDWKHRAFMDLYYTYSVDNINYETAKTILKPTTGTNYWDNSGLYRSSFIYEDNKYYVFYSGQGTNNAKGIGLMSGKDIFNLKTVNY